MSQVSLTNDDFQAGETITDTKIDANFDDLKNAHNNHDAGTSSWQNVKVSNTNTNPVDVTTSASSTEVSINNTNGSDGDPKLTLKKSGTTKAEFLVDDSDSDNIKITDGTNTLLVLNSTAITPSVPLIVPAADASGEAVRYEQVSTLWGYRQPNLKWVSVTQIDVENNTGTQHQTTIQFRDGSVRSVTEDTSSTNKYRRMDITADAEFTSGTEDSGLRAALSEATNTWYAIYAVKSAIDATKFVLVGDTTLPTQANHATLNSAYGTYGWVYLGMIRNGDNSGATGDILNFVQTGHYTVFVNSVAPGGNAGVGTRLANTGGATTVTYTYAAGTGAAQIPNNILHCMFEWSCSAGGTGVDIRQQAASIRYFRLPGLSVSTASFMTGLVSAAAGLVVETGSSTAQDITLAGFLDNALGVGTNPGL